MKRQEDWGMEEDKEAKKLFPIFKRRKKESAEGENGKKEPEVGVPKRPQNDGEEMPVTTEEEENEEKKRMEEERKAARLEKAEKLSKSWELLRICKKMLEENGHKWTKSKERREIERREEEEKRERIEKANKKKGTWTEIGI